MVLDLSDIKSHPAPKIDLSSGPVYIEEPRVNTLIALEGSAGDDLKFGRELLFKTTYLDQECSTRLTAERFSKIEASEEDLWLLCKALADIQHLTIDKNEPLRSLGRATSKGPSSILRSATSSLFAQLQDSSQSKLLQSLSNIGGISRQIDEFRQRPKSTEFEPAALPDFTNSPINRAARASEASTERLNELAGLMAGMASEMGQISKTITAEVLPQWQKSLQDGQAEAKKSIDQATASVKWAKWALFASVFVSAVTCFIQYKQAASYNEDGDKQQAQILEVLKLQLDEQQRTNRALTNQLRLIEEKASAPTSAKSVRRGRARRDTQ
jgi:hypothetical protein